MEEIKHTILLGFESVFGVGSMGADDKYLSIDAPLKQVKILRNIV
jgi:hypothetical protein